MDLLTERAFNWAFEAKTYSSGVQREFDDKTLTEAWKQILSEHLSVGKHTPVIVDVGTGPGFFPILLAEMGYDCIGTDISPEMLREAWQNAKEKGVSPQFLLADADALPFAPGSLDYIISRNVTWTLPDAKQTYRKWVNLLAPGGKILIFDANWNYQFHNDALMQSVQSDYAEYERRYGIPAIQNTERQDEYRRNSPMCMVKRPQWDLEVLSRLKLTELSCIYDISAQIWPEEKQLRFRSTPMFLIVAEK